MRGYTWAFVLAVVAGGCAEDRPVVDPVMAAIEQSTTAGMVGLHVFPDKAIVLNRTDQPVTNCVVVLADTYRGEIGAAPPGQIVTLMRSRFHPYVEADDFYATNQQPRRLECTTDQGPVVVRFGEPFEQTVQIRPRR